MSFGSIFNLWLDECMGENVPKEAKAFCFNLYEPAGIDNVKFGIELIASSEFDEEDSDWPCEEIWEPATRGISIPIEYSGEHWEECLQRIKKLLADKMTQDSVIVEKLKSVLGIGLGFVDGDLEIIWKRVP